MAFSGFECAAFFTAGTTLVAGDIYWLIQTRRFRRRAARALGVIVAQDKSGSRYGTLSAPVFRFETPDRREWTVDSIVGTSPPAFRIGESIAVIYDPADPAGAKIDSITQLWLLPVSGIVVGLVMLVLGLISFQHLR